MPDHKRLNFSGKKVLVVGLGVSGLWTARWLVGQGAEVFVSEVRPYSALDPDMCSELKERGIRLETGGHTRETFLNVEMVVISPGVPHDMAHLRAASEKGIPVMGELELASLMIDTPLIAVTGTNGKSTVTAFLGCILENADLSVFVGGNIGTPLMAYAVGEKKADYAVVEVSSFQLDTIQTFCPYVSMILNISPDHLDRYPGYEDYVQSKLKIFKNQGPGQYVILNDDDERLSSVSPPKGTEVFRFGMEKREGRHAFMEDKKIKVSLDGVETDTFFLESFGLRGRHNLENLLAIAVCCLTIGIDAKVIQKSIDEFKGLPDRLEHVTDINGVAFYSDSKATNVDAAVRAVEGLDRPLILIAGGRHKGADYSDLVKAARGKVKRAVFLGEAKELLAESFDGVLPFAIAEDMEEAVSISFEGARSGDAILLAPACSSFDMFSDYSHRGRVFRKAVERLARG